VNWKVSEKEGKWVVRTVKGNIDHEEYDTKEKAQDVCRLINKADETVDKINKKIITVVTKALEKFNLPKFVENVVKCLSKEEKEFFFGYATYEGKMTIEISEILEDMESFCLEFKINEACK